MAKTKKAARTIVVDGDVAIDWNIAQLSEERAGGPLVWNAGDTAHVEGQRGGAAMLGDIVAGVVRRLPDGRGDRLKLHRQQPALSRITPGDGRYHHSYSLWSPYDVSADDSSAENRVWRVASFLGLDQREVTSGAGQAPSGSSSGSADIVILDDANMGYRDDQAAWPKAVSGRSKPRWVIAKVASPVAGGPLLEHLTSRLADRLITVMTVDDLRRTKAHISRELSWERTAQDLFWELTNSSSVSLLANCAYIVVSLGTAGALWIAGPSSEAPLCNLLFDPRSFEGEWDEEHPGGLIGFTNCLTAGLCRQLVMDWDRDTPDLGRGIRAGVSAMRTLQQYGYGSCTTGGAPVWPRFPTREVVDALGGSLDDCELAQCVVRDPMQVPSSGARGSVVSRRARLWSILDDQCSRTGTTLYQAATKIVIDGVDSVLDKVPLGRFGKLTTADRHEIEGYRCIRGMLTEYCKGESENPISLAVFGPPGSGKSFGVKQVAKSICADIVPMTFNLSQFDSPAALIDALHQVRDVGLSGKIPLVFWDEFDASRDTSEYAWLRYFLAPMQDGEFQSGQITHHIGRAIFVFAGGTSPTMARFSVAVSERKSEKGPDFVSRLKGYMDVMGPNPQDSRLPEADPHYIIRRAIVLRSMMAMHAPQLFAKPGGGGPLRVDPGVLSAFLQTSRYKHGVRSMESIIAMSALWGRTSFERSSLPNRDQLDVHVDGLEFLALAQQPDLSDPDVVDAAAKQIHKCYRRSVSRSTQRRPWNVPWSRLPEDVKEDNRKNVRDIPRKLTAVGLTMVPARGGHAPVGFTEVDIERMAEQEHARWTKEHIADGWVHGRSRDDVNKRHPALRPWHTLTEEEIAELPSELTTAIKNSPLPQKEKNVDRALSRTISDIARSLGYAIVELPSSASDRQDG